MKKFTFCMALAFCCLFNKPALAEFPDYFFDFFVTVDDFEVRLDNRIKDHEVFALEKDSPRLLELTKRLEDSFKKIIVKEKKYYDVYNRVRHEAEKKITRKKDEKIWKWLERMYAYEKTILREKYGENGGRCGINIKIKNTDFPVLYTMELVYSTDNEVRCRLKSSELDYCSPEGILDALARSGENLMRETIKFDEEYEAIMKGK